MFKALLLSFLFIIGISQTSAVVMRWDNFEAGTGLHVHHQGNGWTARETQETDIPFYQELLQKPEVYKTFGTGQLRPKEYISNIVENWIMLFSKGFPTGPLILEKEGKSVGFLMLSSSENPGTGEIARALAPEFQGNGLGKEMLKFIVEEWAPAILRRGLGLDIDTSHPTVENFKCFGGEPLSLISTTSRPSNPASWQGYKHFGFYPSPPTDTTHEISCVDWKASQQESLEESIIKKHFSEISPDPLLLNTLYPMRDETNTLRTLSFSEKYRSLRYHFGRKVD